MKPLRLAPIGSGNNPWPCPLRDTNGRLAINIYFANGSLAVIVAGKKAGLAHLGKWHYKFCMPAGTTAEVINYRAATIRPGQGNDLADEDAYHSGHAKQLELFAVAVLNGKSMPVTAEGGLRVNIYDGSRAALLRDPSKHRNGIESP